MARQQEPALFEDRPTGGGQLGTIAAAIEECHFNEIMHAYDDARRDILIVHIRNTDYEDSAMTQPQNPLQMRGIEFVEFVGPDAQAIHKIFHAFGFSRTMRHRERAVDLYVQNEIRLLLNRAPDSFAQAFGRLHGPSISAMGFRVDDATFAYDEALRRGARPFAGDVTQKTLDLPAIYGIGESLIYFVDRWGADGDVYQERFSALEAPDLVESKGFTAIDHLTNNVYKGTMTLWADFYKSIFGFTEVRYFDIKGARTGLTSYALKSPCGSFCIPINQGNEEKSQIEEYLREYNGPGIQHLAFLSDDLLSSLDKLAGCGIETLDIEDEYYEQVFSRVPNVSEDKERIKAHQVLVDGDDEGYLLQIFTKNLFGPIFIELIQRKNHHSFGEGNFQALFSSIERDQARRGVL